MRRHCVQIEWDRSVCVCATVIMVQAHNTRNSMVGRASKWFYGLIWLDWKYFVLGHYNVSYAHNS